MGLVLLLMVNCLLLLPLLLCGFCVGFLFWNVVRTCSVISSFAIILLRERQQVDLLLSYLCCLNVCVCVSSFHCSGGGGVLIVRFHGHTNLVLV